MSNFQPEDPAFASFAMTSALLAKLQAKGLLSEQEHKEVLADAINVLTSANRPGAVRFLKLFFEKK